VAAIPLVSRINVTYIYKFMKAEAAISIANQIIDLLSSCRDKQGILTVFDIPEKLRKDLTEEEIFKVLEWMKKRQRRRFSVALKGAPLNAKRKSSRSAKPKNKKKQRVKINMKKVMEQVPKIPITKLSREKWKSKSQSNSRRKKSHTKTRIYNQPIRAYEISPFWNRFYAY
jgi:hypothetical protein